MNQKVFKVCALSVAFMAAALAASAQPSACDLRLRVYSYDAVGSQKSRLQNVRVRLRGRNVDRTANVGLDPNDVFSNLTEGRYDAEFSKPGYRARRKRIDLVCGIRDEKNSVWNHTYLWREKSSAGVETDLVEDPKDDSGNVPGGAGIGSRDVATAAADKLVGSVKLNITIDEDGNVISATRIEGDEKLAARAIPMALRAKFTPTLISGTPKRVTGGITYNFIP